MMTAPVALIGRILIALLFVPAGLSKFAGLSGTAAYIASKGLPMPMLLAGGAAVVEVAAGLAIAFGWRTRIAALALALFSLLASMIFHAYWSLPADQQLMQQLLFNKNLAVAGGLLVLTAFGPGALSLDARRRTKP